MVKNKIRKSLLKQGQLFCQDDIEELNSQIQKNVLKEIDIESSKNTLLYFQYKNEIPTNLIIDELLKYSNNIYMPRIVSENELKFNIHRLFLTFLQLLNTFYMIFIHCSILLDDFFSFS